MKIISSVLLVFLLAVGLVSSSSLYAQKKGAKKGTHLLGLEMGMSKEEALAKLQKAGLNVTWRSEDGTEVVLDGSIAGVESKGIRTKYNAAGQLYYFHAEFDKSEETNGKAQVSKVLAAIRKQYGSSQNLQWNTSDGAVVSAIYDFEEGTKLEFLIEKP